MCDGSHYYVILKICTLYSDKKPKIFDKAPVGKLYVDGNVSVAEDSISIKERRNIANNGYLEITIILNTKGKILKKDLEIYNSFHETKDLNEKTVDKLLLEAKKQYVALDRELIFNTQTK